MEENTKTQTGGGYDVKEVTALEKVERMDDTDVLLLIRQTNDGSQKCYSVRGYDFHGEDAYVIARKHGFAGTYEDWLSAVQKVVDVQPAANNLAKATEDAEKATADAITATDAIKLIIKQVTEAEATRLSNEKARISKETERQEAETARYEAEQVRIAAELERADEFRTAKEAVEKATEGANEVVNHPPYVDQDGYYYKWDAGTKNYDKTDVNLTGKAFSIKKVFASVAEMEATDIDAFAENDFVLINTANVEDEDNAKLYVVAIDENGDKFYSYLVDLSGFRGFTGKTPQIIVGNVETLDSQSDVSVSMSADGVDSDGNPRYKLNFGIPRGDHFTFADLTEAEKNELMQPAVEAAEAANSQTLLCQTATNEANDASEKSKEQTTLCQTATNEANEVLKKISDMGSAINIEVTGSGNVLTNAIQTDNKLIFSKGNAAALTPASSGQYQQGNWKRIIQFKVNYNGTLAASLTFEDHPAEINRDTWNECNINIRSNDILFYKISKTKDTRVYKCVGDGDTFSVWLQCAKNNYDGFSHIIITQRLSITEINLDVEYQDSEPTGTYSKFSGISGCVNLANHVPSHTIWGQSFDGSNDITGTFVSGGINIGATNEIWYSGIGDLHIQHGSRGTKNVLLNCGGNAGKVGIGTENPEYKLDVNGTLRATSSIRSAYIESTGDIVAYVSSDARLKTNIHKDDYLKCIESLGGIYAFTYKKNNKDSIGLIAQNLLNTTFVDIVSKDDDGYYKVNYWSPKLISLALGGVEQLSDEVKELRSQVAELKAMIKTLKKNKL